MASKTANKAALSSQKRKASNASSTVSEGSRTSTAPVPTVEPSATTTTAAATTTSAQSVWTTRTRTNSKDNSAISESRLPRKKRRDSCDERSLREGSLCAADPESATGPPSTGRIRLGLGGSLGSMEDGRIRVGSSFDCTSDVLHGQMSTADPGSSHLPPLEELHSLNGLASDHLLSTSENIANTLLNHDSHETDSSLPKLPPISSSLDQLDPLLNVDDHQTEDATKIVADALADHGIPKSVEPTARQNGDDDEVSLTSSGHGLLLDAMGMQDLPANDATKKESDSNPSALQQLAAIAAVPEEPHAVINRERQDSITTAQSRDRWDTFAATIAAAHCRERIDSLGTRFESTLNVPGAGGRERADSWMGRRDRLESWGGMSDLSVPVAGVAPPSSILLEDPPHHFSQQLSGALGQDPRPGAIPSRISLNRDRLNSIASLGDTLQRDRVNSIASMGDLSLSAFAGNVVDGMEVASDIQAFVAAAMATVGDQLMELAGEMEEVAGETMNFEDFRREMGFESEGGDSASVASPLIGAVSDAAHGGRGRPRTWSTSSGRISVDLDAVLAAVDAADAASGSLGLLQHSPAILPTSTPSSLGLKKRSTREASKAKPAPGSFAAERPNRRNLPLKRKHGDSNASSSVASEEQLQSRRRETKDHLPNKAANGRTKRGAASQTKAQPPLKKRGRRTSPETPATVVSASIQPTPKVSNRTVIGRSDEVFEAPPMVVSSSSIAYTETKQSKQSGQAGQKWEVMYDCLLEFAMERQIEETKTMSDTEKQSWIWDGNVPTNYKTKDGKALGRWVNNQRSAKSKGNLKDDREERLIEAGLKWSVLASNCWNEMLEELSIYIKDQHRQGKAWDGNVPTNYQIKSRPNGGFNGEDKNLGRWINRQRSMFQAGRLRKDRQLALEGIGLKWSMLATTSWESMYDTLTEYIDDLKKSGVTTWDGNVPANHRTNHHPPRSLGRWVNRQRSAYAKSKLKKECIDKLTVLGLKWSVHSRFGGFEDIDDGDDGEFMDELPSHESKVGASDAIGKETAENKPVEAVPTPNIHTV